MTTDYRQNGSVVICANGSIAVAPYRGRSWPGLFAYANNSPLQGRDGPAERDQTERSRVRELPWSLASRMWRKALRQSELSVKS